MEHTSQESFRPRIEQRLAAIDQELQSLADATQVVAPDVSIGRLSRLDSMQQQQMALAGRRRLEEERARLVEALRRIEARMYGRCLLCGEDIATERLEIQPDAITCVPCLQKKR